MELWLSLITFLESRHDHRFIPVLRNLVSCQIHSSGYVNPSVNTSMLSMGKNEDGLSCSIVLHLFGKPVFPMASISDGRLVSSGIASFEVSCVGPTLAVGQLNWSLVFCPTLHPAVLTVNQ